MNENYPERLVPNTKEWEMGFADHFQRYKFTKKLCEGKNVLDAACGTGYGSLYLSENGAKSVTAIDISDETICLAKKNYINSNLTFIVDDCEQLATINKKYDVIVALECIEHFENPEKFLTRCVQVIDDRGIMVVSTPNATASGRLSKNEKPLNPYHFREYTYSQLLKFLNIYFSDVKIFFQVKSKYYLFYEDTIRFVNFAYKFSPILRFGLFIRKLIKRRGRDPIIRRIIPTESDFEIKSELNMDDNSCYVFIAICKDPIRN